MTAQLVDMPSEPKKLLSFKGQKYQYAFRSFHFGANNQEGSLHALYGQKFPLEVHSNFFNTKYRSFSNGLNHPDGTLTAAELYQVSINY